jgi:hypothetical protein
MKQDFDLRISTSLFCKQAKKSVLLWSSATKYKLMVGINIKWKDLWLF